MPVAPVTSPRQGWSPFRSTQLAERRSSRDRAGPAWTQPEGAVQDPQFVTDRPFVFMDQRASYQATSRQRRPPEAWTD
jgi:hypothetical protein